MKSVTIDDVMAWEPCGGYTRARVTELFTGREAVTALDILDMDILHGDRVEAFLRGGFVDDMVLRLLAYDFAEHVLPLFETEYPDDKRLRRLIEAARKWEDGTIEREEFRIAVSAAAGALGMAAVWGESPATNPYLPRKIAALHVCTAAHRATASLFPSGAARLTALFATKACNLVGDGKERRWQVKRIREVLEERGNAGE